VKDGPHSLSIDRHARNLNLQTVRSAKGNVDHYYQDLDRAAGFDYELHTVAGLGSEYYRGPTVDTCGRYLAFVGGAQTFGRFASEPFPTLLGRRLGIPVLNLGIGGAGPRHFNAPRYLSLLNKAEAVVVQVMSGRSSSNSLFDNSVAGRLRGVTPFSKEPIRADEFFARAAESYSRETLERLVKETREDYTEQFIDLIKKISVPRMLLWFSTRAPAYQEDYSRPPNSIFGPFPQLVNSKMVAEVAAFCDDYVECISTAGLPQALLRGDRSMDGAVSNNGMIENRYYPSPEMHVAVADALEGACSRFIGRRGPAPATEPASRFVIVAAERTGTNLLVSLLNQHEYCLCGNELFNPVNIARDTIPWPDIAEPERERLIALRRADAVEFWKDLCATSLSRGYRAVGFKLMYSHGLTERALLEYLLVDRGIRVIHLTRRNLLRRLVSERQARATNQWAVVSGAKVDSRLPVAITINDFVESIQIVEAQQARFHSMFRDHPVLRIVYEDLAERPERVAARAAEFLGLSQRSNRPSIVYQKTGAEDLSQAITGFDELRARVRWWTSFFES
jgi:LPS sulfotransferase NodH